MSNTSITQFITENTSDQWENDLLRHSTMINEEIFMSEESHTFNIRSDHGFKDGKGSFGVILQKDNQLVLSSKGQIIETYCGLSSYSNRTSFDSSWTTIHSKIATIQTTIQRIILHSG
jgi:hypothetical protein